MGAKDQPREAIIYVISTLGKNLDTEAGIMKLQQEAKYLLVI